MLKASELMPGRIYRPTRRLTGMPASYYMVTEPAKLRALVRRLKKKPIMLRKPEDNRVLYGVERGHVVLEAYRRYVTDAAGKQEDRSRFAIDSRAVVGLREVKAKPGYTAKETA